MADDTVASTRQELETRITEIVAGLIDDTEIAQAIDAVIAAVRAEEAERHGETVIAFEGHGIAPDEVVDGYSYSADVVRKKIAAVRAEKLPSVTCINCGHRMEAFFRDGKPLR